MFRAARIAVLSLLVAGSTHAAAIATGDGLTLDLDPATGAVAGLWLDGVSAIDSSVAGGLFVRDREEMLKVTPAITILTANPSFEVDADRDSMPDGWIFEDSWGLGATMVYGSDAADGVRSVTITGAGGAMRADLIPVVPGQRYLAQTLAKGTAATQVLVIWYDADEYFLFYESGAAEQPTVAWTPTHLMMVAPQRAAFAEVRVYTVSNGSASFDLARGYAAPAAAWSMVAGPVVASGSDLIQTASLPALSLDLTATYRARAEHLEVEVRVVDRAGRDRAIEAGFVTPVQARKFWDGPSAYRDITQQSYGELFAYTYWGGIYNDGHWGGDRSIYPFAAVTIGGVYGIGVGYDIQNGPRDVQWFHSTHIGESFVSRFRLGLAAEPTAFPRSAGFQMMLFRVDGNDGFRSAQDRYYRMVPVFENRMPVVGGWSPYRRPRDLPAAADFGIAVHTYDDDVAFDDAASVLSLGQLPGFDYWLPLGDYSSEPTYADAVTRLDFNANDPGVDPTLQAEARATVVSGLQDRAGVPSLDVVQVGWMPGSGWAATCAINPDPEVSDRTTNGWSSTFDRYSTRLDAAFARAQTTGATLDGAFLDWFRSWHDDLYNHRRVHFETCDYSPSFDPATMTPALPEPFAHWEALVNIASRMRARGGFTMARDIDYPSFWATAELDAFGQELDWTTNESSEERLQYYRTVAGRKPYMILLNANYSTIDVGHVLRRALLHGLFFSPWWDSDSSQSYWDTSLWMRDRPLFQRYVQLLRMEHQSGYEPLTFALASDPALALERWGNGLTSRLLFSAWNRTGASITPRVTIDLAGLGIAANTVRRVVDLVGARVVPSTVAGSILTVDDAIDPDAARLYHVHGGTSGLVLRAVKRGADVELSWTDSGGGVYEVLREDGDPRLRSALVAIASQPTHTDIGAVPSPASRYYSVE